MRCRAMRWTLSWLKMAAAALALAITCVTPAVVSIMIPKVQV